MMFQKIKRYIQGGYDYYLLKKMEQFKYELEEEVKLLEKAYDDSHSQIIWERLELKREELLNVSEKLANRKMKKDEFKPR